MKFLSILTTIVGIVMSLGYFPQAYNIYKTKPAGNISFVSFTIFAIGTSIWTIYGFVIKDVPLIFSFVIGVIGSWTVLGLALYYKKKSDVKNVRNTVK